MAFICELCGIQVCRGRPFLHTHSHSTDTWDRPAMVDFMNRFPDTFCTVTDSCLIGPNNLAKGMETLTVAQAFGTTTHSRRSRRQHPSNYSQTCVVAATEQSEDRPLLPKQDILMKNLKWNGMRRTMSRVDHWIHTRSKLSVTRKCSIYGTEVHDYAAEAVASGVHGGAP